MSVIDFPKRSIEAVALHRLFFMLKPDPAVAKRIVAGARHEHKVRKMAGEPIAADRLHVSLFGLGAYEGGLPAGLLDRAREAGGMMASAPFEVAFDRLMSFDRVDGEHPLVLAGGDGLAALQTFRARLAVAMAKVGLKIYARPRTIVPHVTLLYDAHFVEERDIAPICWTVRDFVLVDSLYGEHCHIEMGRWRLRDV